MVLTLEKDWQKWNEFMTIKRYIVDEDSWGDCTGFVNQKAYEEYLGFLRKRGGVDIVVVHSGSKPIGYMLAMRVGLAGEAFCALQASGMTFGADDAIASLSPKEVRGRRYGVYLSLCVMNIKYRDKTGLLLKAVKGYLSTLPEYDILMVADSRGGISFADKLGLTEMGKTASGKLIYGVQGR